MATIIVRSYSCKDEEVPVIGGFALINIRRDLVDFTAFSHRFNNDYVEMFESKINSVKQLTSAEMDTVEHKKITEQIKSDCETIGLELNKIKSYLMLSKTISITPADFGITATRRSINSKDIESILNNLKILNANIAKHKSTLQAEGMPDSLVDKILLLSQNIDQKKQMQYQIISNRRLRVQDNISQINDLFAMINEVLSVGRALYKKVDPAREKDYNMTELKKRVHNTYKSSLIKEEKAQDKEK